MPVKAFTFLSLWLLVSRASALDIADAAHLLARTGFGATPEEIAPLAPLDRAQAVSLLLADARTTPVVLLPEWADDNPLSRRPGAKATAEDKQAFAKAERARAAELEGWWYHEMAATDSPLTERMVLFWHNHFTSSLQKVRFPELMLRQNLLLRRLALGSFSEMAHQVARDPAMLLYLDGQTNVKAHPNENFARELMELFTVGEGHYTESDVREAARAFTGWRVNPRTGAFFVDAKRHDDGVKTILGRTGRWSGDDVIDILLSRPETAVFVVDKLWREFISAAPDPVEVAKLASAFASDGYRIKPLMQALLTTDAFWAPANRGTLVKSPVELAVGMNRLLDLGPQLEAALPRVGRGLGEEVFDPPTVRGWPGGEQWIDSRTLLGRESFVKAAIRSAGLAAGRPGRAPAAPAADGCTSRVGGLRQWVAEQGGDPYGPLAELLLPLPPSHPAPGGTGPLYPGGFAAALRAVLSDPSYQLD
jgi:uncharacterized protein (DUF1800 family)